MSIRSRVRATRLLRDSVAVVMASPFGVAGCSDDGRFGFRFRPSRRSLTVRRAGTAGSYPATRWNRDRWTLDASTQRMGWLGLNPAEGVQPHEWRGGSRLVPG